MDEFVIQADRLRAERVPFVLATVVRAERPTSARTGDRALVLPDGRLEGFVGGTCAASTVRSQALRLLESGESALLRITPSPDEQPPEGMLSVTNPCLSGGTLDIFLEAVIPPTLVQVYGDGPVARALATVGAATGYEMQVLADPPVAIRPDAAAVVVASHGRDEDHVLSAALRAEVPYIGLIASRRRGSAVIAALEGGDRVHTPAGLDIGARTPAEIALSVVAEIMSLRPRVPAAPPAPAPATDPVCGMEVLGTDSALHARHADRDWYFCGPGCLRAFTDAPDRYAVTAG